MRTIARSLRVGVVYFGIRTGDDGFLGVPGVGAGADTGAGAGADTGAGAGAGLNMFLGGGIGAGAGCIVFLGGASTAAGCSVCFGGGAATPSTLLRTARVELDILTRRLRFLRKMLPHNKRYARGMDCRIAPHNHTCSIRVCYEHLENNIQACI